MVEMRRLWEPKDLRTLVAVAPPFIDVEALAVAVAANYPGVEVTSIETTRTLLRNKRVTIRLSGDLRVVVGYRDEFSSALRQGAPSYNSPLRR
jgi:hypothetical protein